MLHWANVGTWSYSSDGNILLDMKIKLNWVCFREDSDIFDVEEFNGF